jgi:hypothetical protein
LEQPSENGNSFKNLKWNIDLVKDGSLFFPEKELFICNSFTASVLVSVVYSECQSPRHVSAVVTFCTQSNNCLREINAIILLHFTMFN